MAANPYQMMSRILHMEIHPLSKGPFVAHYKGILQVCCVHIYETKLSTMAYIVKYYLRGWKLITCPGVTVTS